MSVLKDDLSSIRLLPNESIEYVLKHEPIEGGEIYVHGQGSGYTDLKFTAGVAASIPSPTYDRVSVDYDGYKTFLITNPQSLSVSLRDIYYNGRSQNTYGFFDDKSKSSLGRIVSIEKEITFEASDTSKSFTFYNDSTGNTLFDTFGVDDIYKIHIVSLCQEEQRSYEGNRKYQTYFDKLYYMKGYGAWTDWPQTNFRENYLTINVENPRSGYAGTWRVLITALVENE